MLRVLENRVPRCTYGLKNVGRRRKFHKKTVPPLVLLGKCYWDNQVEEQKIGKCGYM